MLQPSNSKYRKVHRVSVKDSEKNGSLAFGVYGLKSLENGILNSKELFAGRMAIKRGLKKSGSTWLRVYPDICVTSKKSGGRMGKGKGVVTGWVCGISKGQVIYELAGIPKELAYKVLGIVGSKLSVKTKVVILKE